MRLISTSRK